jgi:nicotinamidase-related amidase
MPSRRALFVIDIQKELIADPDTRIPNPKRVINAAEEILKVSRSILDSYESSNSPSPWLIVFVQHEEFPPEGTMLRGSEPWELFFSPRANRQDEILVSKSTGLYILKYTTKIVLAKHGL